METTIAAKRARGDSAPSLDSLPSEVFSTLSAFLLGIDLFKLTHVSPRLRSLIDADSANVWRSRVIPYDHTTRANEYASNATAKKQTVSDRSLEFRGTRKESSVRRVRWRCIYVVGLNVASLRHRTVAFDTWFSLLPGDEDTYAGGILLGAQSCFLKERQMANQHKQFLHFDADLQLYCSMADTKEPLAKLIANRWYHLALMFDGSRQCVYLDGVVISDEERALHRESQSLYHLQVGTGCLPDGAMNHTAPKGCRWYGFHGIVDEFRMWGDVLSAEDVRKLARGVRIEEPPMDSIHHNLAERGEGKPTVVRCSRPRERVCEIYK